MTVGGRTVLYNFEQFVGCYELVALKDATQSVDSLRGELGQICEGAVFDLSVFAIALPKEDGWRGCPIGDGGNVHADYSNGITQE